MLATVDCTPCKGTRGHTLVLKIVKPDKFKIHSFLTRITSPDNHTIPHDFPRDVAHHHAAETVLSNARPRWRGVAYVRSRKRYSKMRIRDSFVHSVRAWLARVVCRGVDDGEARGWAASRSKKA